MKPSQEQFEDYIRIRNSGVTNMFDISTVCAISGTGLTRDICFYIMDHFDELCTEYGVR